MKLAAVVAGLDWTLAALLLITGGYEYLLAIDFKTPRVSYDKHL